MEFIEQNYNTLVDALPQEVNDLISASVNIAEIFPINQNERFDKQILMADEFVFQANASLTFANLNYPYIIMMAKKWKFTDIANTFSIGFDTKLKGTHGRDGVSGRAGALGQGEVQRRGNDGQAGENGQNAENGSPMFVPNIYIIGEEFICNNVEQDINRLKFVLSFRGVDGGDGGNGGNGGTGGQGADGKEGATSMFGCNDGAGQGGTGGTGGIGGRGGDAGQGTNGSNIFLIGVGGVPEILSYSKIYNYGGRPGRPGRAGRVGNGGRAGNGGGGRGYCSPGPRGEYGIYPTPNDYGDGNEAIEGEKGLVYKVVLNQI